MSTQWTYFAADGSFGDAGDLVVIDTTNFTDADWAAIEEASDLRRKSLAEFAAVNLGAELVPAFLNTEVAR